MSLQELIVEMPHLVCYQSIHCPQIQTRLNTVTIRNIPYETSNCVASLPILFTITVREQHCQIGDSCV